MSITAEMENGVSHLHIAGDMTIYTATDLKEEMMAHLSHPEIDLDLSEVCELDSAGLQLLMLAKREAQREGRTLHLVNHSRAVMEVFDICNLAPYFGDPLVISQGGNA